MTRHELRNRSRARYQRRLRRRLAAAALLLVLFGSAGALGMNAVEIFGTAPPPEHIVVAAAEVDAKVHGRLRQRRARREAAKAAPTAVPAPIVKLPQRQAPAAPKAAAAVRKVARTKTVSRYVPPGSRVSQRVKWEMARLKRLARQQQTEGFRKLSSSKPGKISRPSRRVRPNRRPSPNIDPSQHRKLWLAELFRFKLDLEDLASRRRRPPAPPRVPEPSTAILFGGGLVGLGLWRQRRTLSVGASHS